ncbi:Fungal specific transcription factor domain-containing protein 11 [Elsinoe fawcettii]|nr:Fungal specific transcription factor domain-containing protein 11 [Elsinoe fawcettii]
MEDLGRANISVSPHSIENSPLVGNPGIMQNAPHQYSNLDGQSHHSAFSQFQPPLDPNMMSTPMNNQPFSFNGRSSISGLSDGASPVGSDVHRMSFGSSAPFLQQLQPPSLDGSDHTSPVSMTGVNAGPAVTSQPAKGTSKSATAKSSGTGADKAKGKEKDKDKNNDKEGIDGSDAPPSWAELKTKAGKERKRLPLACIACRRKKIRCSGEKPACKHCLRSRIPCVYKVTTRKAAPRTDYMAMLDKRLKRMEERVIKIMPKDEQRNIDVIGRAVVKPAIPGLPPKPDNKKRVADEAFGEDLDSWARTRPNKNIHSQIKGEEPRDDLMTEGAEHLPSSELQQHLAEVFFDYVYGQSYHLLHKPSYMRKLEAGQLPPVLVLSVCAISARFSEHPDVRTDPAFLRGEKWAKPAREIALKRYDTPNITILICYLLLGLHEFGTCQGGRSWMLGGMAQRMAYALQLHKDLEIGAAPKPNDEKNELTFTDREIRRRTMWACFMMDRFNSSGTDRPMFVAESYIELQLPIKEHYFQMEITGTTEYLEGKAPRTVEPDSGQIANPRHNMGVAAYMVRIVSIWGHVVRYINLGGREKDTHAMWSDASGFSQLKRSTDEYCASLPEFLQWNEENLQAHASEKTANQFIFLHITINQVKLFMNRFALPISGSRPPFTKEMPAEFINDCARTALEAAGQISTMVNEAHDHRVVAPFAGYSAFLSSTVHISGLSSKNPAIEASSKQYLAWNVKYLSKMKKYWGMFYFVTEHLKDLYRRQVDAGLRAQQGTATPAGAKPQEAIFQYGDWFDRYPHGVTGTDYEEAGNEVKKEPGADALFGQKPDLQSVEDFFAKMSPPSRAAQSRKVAKKKQSKSIMQNNSVADNSNNTQNTPSGQQQIQQPSHQIPQMGARNQHMQMPPVDTNMFQNQQNYQNNFSPAGQGSNSANPFSATAMSDEMAILQAQQNQPFQQMHHPGLMSHLDRQMVLSSYAGLDGAAGNTPGNPLHAIDPLNFPTEIDLNGDNFGFTPGQAGQNSMTSPPGASGMASGQNAGMVNARGMNDGQWNEASSLSWFMPFNVDPPNAMGDESGLFASAYDFASLAGLGGFGTGDGMGTLDGLGGDGAQGPGGGVGDHSGTGQEGV